MCGDVLRIKQPSKVKPLRLRARQRLKRISSSRSHPHGKARLRDVQLSPDRRKLAVTLTVEPRFFEWGDPVDLTIVVDAN